MAKKDINTATHRDLQDVPQMSQARAETIIHYRDSHGDFKDMQELADVPGIGETMAQQMAEYFSVGDADDQEDNQPDDEGEDDTDTDDTESEGEQQQTSGEDKPQTQRRRTGRRTSSSSSSNSPPRRSGQG